MEIRVISGFAGGSRVSLQLACRRRRRLTVETGIVLFFKDAGTLSCVRCQKPPYKSKTRHFLIFFRASLCYFQAPGVFHEWPASGRYCRCCCCFVCRMPPGQRAPQPAARPAAQAPRPPARAPAAVTAPLLGALSRRCPSRRVRRATLRLPSYSLLSLTLGSHGPHDRGQRKQRRPGNHFRCKSNQRHVPPLLLSEARIKFRNILSIPA